MDAPVRYTRTSDGVDIAYYAIGRGLPLVYIAPGSHREREWQYREQRLWLERLAARYRLIRFDHCGTGLSDRDTEYSPDEAVCDNAGIAAAPTISMRKVERHIGNIYVKIAARNRAKASASTFRDGSQV
jgi:pimeloyl-ACP methyl ester carboxylesterase